MDDCSVRILHICNDFCGSMVHSNLYQSLSRYIGAQCVYAYFDYGGRSRNHFPAQNTTFVFDGLLRKYHHYIYHLKINTVYQSLIKNVDPTQYNCVHATTLLSDGALAYKLYKEYRLPYVVTVRNTDINIFLNYAPHTWITAAKILKHAACIVFISKALLNKFTKHPLVRTIYNHIYNKIVLLPNGVDDFWIDNKVKKKGNSTACNFIFIGRLDANKNIMRLIRAVINVAKEYPTIKLNIIGGDGKYEKAVKRYASQYPKHILYHGKINDKYKLMCMYRHSNYFVMPSMRETFGLVYIEALSQGLPIIYTKGQGIDGMFVNNVGESVNPHSIKSIQQALVSMMHSGEMYDELSNQFDLELFRWRNIAKKYMELYQNIITSDRKTSEL